MSLRPPTPEHVSVTGSNRVKRGVAEMLKGGVIMDVVNVEQARIEADHLLAWQKGGTTGISNLGQPCPKYHRLRHSITWGPTPASKNEPPGWISPAGRRYKSEHQDWEPPHWPIVRGHPDFVHMGVSLGEKGLERNGSSTLRSDHCQ